MRWGPAALLLTATGLAGCVTTCGDNLPGTDASPADDASPLRDGRAGADGADPLLDVTVSIAGCEESGGVAGDAGAPVLCRGAAPVSATFTVIAQADIDVYDWDFGDGSVSDAASPVHTFASPGVYTVSLSVQGGGGSLAISLTDAVEILPGTVGASCADAGDCQSGLCVCGDGQDCDIGLSQGLCAASCDAVAPCAEGACVDPTPSDPTNPEPWQQPLCAATCGECAGELTCRPLLAEDGSQFVDVCFAPAAPLAIGASCFDAAGAPVADDCAGGLCLAEGARGLCSFDCSGAACPTGAACATFSAGPANRCLRECTSAADCNDDPWLDCVAPGGAGAKGFSVNAMPAATYCAPKPCMDAADCGSDGACNSGYCGPS